MLLGAASVALPSSLKNIFLELRNDLGSSLSNNGCLVPRARQDVPLLNTTLTVRVHAATSHRGKGRERFTDDVIRGVNEKESPVLFALWGGAAQRKAELLTPARHPSARAAHPSSLSARNGFFGSRPFSAMNAALRR